MLQIGKVGRKKPCILGVRVLSTISTDKNLAARLTIQKLEHASITVPAARPRFNIKPTNRRRLGTRRRGSCTSRAQRVNADPQPPSIMEKVVYSEGKRSNF